MNLSNKVEEFLDTEFGIFLKNFFIRLREDNVTAIGAQLSYYLLMSIFPFIMFFLNILSFTSLATEPVLLDILKFLPNEVSKLILNLVDETVKSSNEAFLSFSAITGLWAASKGARAFIRVMNQAYDVEETRGFLYTNILAMFFTIALFISFILVLITLVFGEVIANRVFVYLGFGHKFLSFWKRFRTILSLMAMIIIFGLMFKYGPDKGHKPRMKFKYTLPGAIFSSLGWVITSTIFSYYVNNFGNFSKTYGSLGGIIVLMLWLYMSSIIIIIGGEINATLKHMRNGEKTD